MTDSEMDGNLTKAAAFVKYNGKTYKLTIVNGIYVIYINESSFYYINNDYTKWKADMKFLTIDGTDYLFNNYNSQLLNLTIGGFDKYIVNLPKVFALTKGDWITYKYNNKIYFSKIDHSYYYIIEDDIDWINELEGDDVELKLKNNGYYLLKTNNMEVGITEKETTKATSLKINDETFYLRTNSYIKAKNWQKYDKEIILNTKFTKYTCVKTPTEYNLHFDNFNKSWLNIKSHNLLPIQDEQILIITDINSVTKIYDGINFNESTMYKTVGTNFIEKKVTDTDKILFKISEDQTTATAIILNYKAQTDITVDGVGLWMVTDKTNAKALYDKATGVVNLKHKVIKCHGTEYIEKINEDKTKTLYTTDVKNKTENYTGDIKERTIENSKLLKATVDGKQIFYNADLQPKSIFKIHQKKIIWISVGSILIVALITTLILIMKKRTK